MLSIRFRWDAATTLLLKFQRNGGPAMGIPWARRRRRRCGHELLGRVGPLLGAGLLASCGGRNLVVTEENDLFSSGAFRDRDYTQGLQLEAAAAGSEAAVHFSEGALRPLQFLDPWLLASSADSEDFTVRVDQRLYTPRDFESPEPPPLERPYTGLLLGTITRFRVRLDPDPDRRRDDLATLAVTLGLTGDAALGEQTQRGVHLLANQPDAVGWDTQADTEPVLQVDLSRTRRLGFARPFGLEPDAAATLGARLGTAFTNAHGEFVLRLGNQLPRARRPWAEAPRPGHRVHLIAAIGGRAVAHDITLDGGLFDDRDLQIVSRPLVGTWRFGIEWESHGFRIAYRFRRQTKEYDSEIGNHDHGSISVGYAFAF